jgi:hypothetical protein
MQNPYVTERLAAEHRRQLLEEARKGSLAKARPGRSPWVHVNHRIAKPRSTGSYLQTKPPHTAKEVVMGHIHFVRRTAGVVLAICSSLLSFVLFAPSAFGLMVDFPTYANGRAASLAGTHSAVSQPQPTIVHTVVTGGMAGWLITLIAVGAALLAATVAVLMDRARAAHRKLTASAA